METKSSTIEHEGLQYVLKKPIWKQWLFWVVLGLALLSFVAIRQNAKLTNKIMIAEEASATLNDSARTSKLLDNIINARKLGLSDGIVIDMVDAAMRDLGISEYEKSEDSKDNDSSSQLNNNHKIGDAVFFNDDSKVTVTAVREAPEVEMTDVIDGQVKVVVEVTIENLGTKPLDVNSQRFSLYDSNSEIGDFNSSTYRNSIPHEIASGMKANLVIHFTANSGGPFAISYADVIWRQ